MEQAVTRHPGTQKIVTCRLGWEKKIREDLMLGGRSEDSIVGMPRGPGTGRKGVKKDDPRV